MKDQDLIITRTFEAPRERVRAAYRRSEMCRAGWNESFDKLAEILK